MAFEGVEPMIATKRYLSAIAAVALLLTVQGPPTVKAQPAAFARLTFFPIAISADASTVVGTERENGGNAIRWTAATDNSVLRGSATG